MKVIGDFTRPRVYCLECNVVIYCDTIHTEFPPDTARKRLEKIHKENGCKGAIEYRAGFVPRLPVKIAYTPGFVRLACQRRQLMKTDELARGRRGFAGVLDIKKLAAAKSQKERDEIEGELAELREALLEAVQDADANRPG